MPFQFRTGFRSAALASIVAAMLFSGAGAGHAIGPPEEPPQEPTVVWFDDVLGALSVAEAVALPSEEWRVDRSNFSSRAPGVHWARIELGTRGEYILDSYGGWGALEAWRVQGNGNQRFGYVDELMDWRERPVPSDNLTLRLQAPARATVLARLSTSEAGPANPEWIGLNVIPEAEWLERSRNHYVLNGVYSGVVFAVVAYTLFLFIATRYTTYLLYVLYAGSFGLTWIAESGFGFEFLWGGMPLFQRSSDFFFPALAAFWGTWFGRAFLDSKRLAPRADRVLMGLQVCVLGALGLDLLGFGRLSETVLGLASFAILVTVVWATIKGLKVGYKPARIFVFANGPLLLFVGIYIFGYFGLIERSFLVVHGAQFASAVEKVLLAFGVANRMNFLKADKLKADRARRRSLEAEVEDRTRALEAARSKLEETNVELVEANHQLAELSTVDALTGVANRRQFDIVLQTEWARCLRHQADLSLLLVDVDHFKQFNDSLGHLEGDECLIAIAQALQNECRRAGDLVARYGGEEFAVILPATHASEADLLADRLRLQVQCLEIAHQASAVCDVVTVSVGRATVVPSAEMPSLEVIRLADRALYDAKRSGRNRVAAA